MTDSQLLYLVFLVLYLADGLGRYPLSAVLFVKPWWSRKRWFLKKPIDVAARLGEGYYILPALGAFFATGEGWWFSEPQEKRIRWVESPESDAIQARVKKPKNVWRDRSRLEGPKNTGKWIFPNAATALDALLWLRSILPSAIDLSPEIRDRTAKSLSLPRARAAVKKSHLVVRQFVFWEWLSTIYCFVALPCLFWYFKNSPWGLLCLLAIFPMAFITGIIWWRVVGRVFPRFKKGRWYKVLPVIFLPHHALRVARQLTAELSIGCHPLAMGQVVLEKESFIKFAGDYMRRLRYPLSGTIPESAWKTHYEQCAEFLTEKCRLPETKLMAQSPEPDGISESYCPRCHSQFLDAEATCDTCDEIPTVKFKNPESTEAAR